MKCNIILNTAVTLTGLINLIVGMFMSFFTEITPAKARIFRICHINNLSWILTHGLHCANAEIKDPHFTQIGLPELIQKRSTKKLDTPYGGILADYVPFYFTSKTPMLYNIKTGYHGMIRRSMDEIIILVTSLHSLTQNSIPFVIADRHAYSATVTMMTDLSKLNDLSWDLWQRSDFSRDPNDPEKVERYQAETLIYKHLPICCLRGVIVYSIQQQEIVDAMLKRADIQLPTVVSQMWYF